MSAETILVKGERLYALAVGAATQDIARVGDGGEAEGADEDDTSPPGAGDDALTPIDRAEPGHEGRG